MLHKLKSNILVNLKNIPGWHTRRKLIIIESDDWGSIRMPSNEVFSRLISAGIKVGRGLHNRCETLETKEDLEELFNVLDSVRDQNNKPAVMTPVTIIANPDFNKIRLSGFNEYFYEKFTDTLKSYYPDNDVFKLWKEGIDTGIFVPELHGRDHITVQLWLNKLREGNKDLLYAFDQGFVALNIPGVPPPAGEFRAEFYFDKEEQKPFLIKGIKESVSLFKDIFGFSPRSFVPSNELFHPEFDSVVAETGIKFLYVSHSMPYPDKEGVLKYRHFINGQKGPGDLIYYTRNCAFEPNEEGYSGIESTIRQIAAAFRWHKPAFISTHRGNFSGGIDPGNRKKGLAELKKLLRTITNIWPEAEFMSSENALEFMKESNYQRS